MARACRPPECTLPCFIRREHGGNSRVAWARVTPLTHAHTHTRTHTHTGEHFRSASCSPPQRPHYSGASTMWNSSPTRCRYFSASAVRRASVHVSVYAVRQCIRRRSTVAGSTSNSLPVSGTASCSPRPEPAAPGPGTGPRSARCMGLADGRGRGGSLPRPAMGLTGRVVPRRGRRSLAARPAPPPWAVAEARRADAPVAGRGASAPECCTTGSGDDAGTNTSGTTKVAASAAMRARYLVTNAQNAQAVPPPDPHARGSFCAAASVTMRADD
jgi:hypothetical protein